MRDIRKFAMQLYREKVSGSAWSRQCKKIERRIVRREIVAQIASASFEALRDQDQYEFDQVPAWWLNDVHLDDCGVLPANVTLVLSE